MVAYSVSGLRRLALVRPRATVIARGLASLKQPSSLFAPLDTFTERHVGPEDSETTAMLSKLGYKSMEEFLGDAVPSKIRIPSTTVDDSSIPAFSESELLKRARELAQKNKPMKSYIGMGYHNAAVPPVLENPQWYMPYTPYQPEIAQGRLESLVNFQTMVMSLT
ncbi:glycine cleavage system P-protein-domain-containing protein, partial [Schizophyllum fasciatum]